MIVVGVDPGQTTGLAWWDVELGTLTTTATQPAQAAVWNLWEWLERYQLEGTGVEVACERFVIGPQTLRASRQYDALEVTGALRFKCQQLGVELASYPAAQSKRLVTNDRLHRLGVYRSGRGHENDATRQALTHLAVTRRATFQALLG